MTQKGPNALCTAIVAFLLFPSALPAAERDAPNGNAALNIALSQSGIGGGQWSMFKNRKKRTGRTGLVGPQTNGLRWEHLLKRLGIQSPQAIGHDGTIYSGSYAGALYAFAPDGSIKWKHSLGNYQITAGPRDRRRRDHLSSIRERPSSRIRPERCFEMGFQSQVL
jgi:hypothetical protein